MILWYLPLVTITNTTIIKWYQQLSNGTMLAVAMAMASSCQWNAAVVSHTALGCLLRQRLAVDIMVPPPRHHHQYNNYQTVQCWEWQWQWHNMEYGSRIPYGNRLPPSSTIIQPSIIHHATNNNATSSEVQCHSPSTQCCMHIVHLLFV